MDGRSGEADSEIGSIKTVLVIDDEELNVKLLTRMLTGEGFRVLGAASAEAGLELLRQERPDVILMDTRLGGIDGLEATRWVKSNPDFVSIPSLQSALTQRRRTGHAPSKPAARITSQNHSEKRIWSKS